MSYLASFVNLVVTVLSIAIIGRALMSWFDPGMQSPVGRLLHQVTEPIIAPIRQVVPSMGMLDLSPMVALILLWILRAMLQGAIG